MIYIPNVNKKFKNLVWFHSTFYNNNNIFFFRHSESQASILLDNIKDLISNNIGYKFFHSKSGINGIKYFEFLTGSFSVVYTSKLSTIFTMNLQGFQLFATNNCGYFINPSYLNDIYYNYLFYKNNYLFIMSYMLWFYSVLNIYISQYNIIITQIHIILNYYINLYSVLQSLLKQMQLKKF